MSLSSKSRSPGSKPHPKLVPHLNKIPSHLGRPNPHLNGWRFSNGEPPNPNEAWFCGRDAGAVWAACVASPAELEAFLCASSTSDFRELMRGAAHDYLRVEVTFGRQGWVCASPELASAFTRAFIEAVEQVARRFRQSDTDESEALVLH